MKFKTGDTVIVIAGKHKGKTGKISKINREKDTVIVEKVNMLTGYRKKTATAAGEKSQKEAPIHASNVMILCPKTNKPSRIGVRMLKNGKKERFAKKTGETLA
jgi:large subunit ribosomal protein L24